MTSFPAVHIWKAKSDPKCKFFAWLILHNKASTADNLSKKHWPCNPICPLCTCMPETAKHLMAECNYTEALWDQTAHHYNLPSYPCMMNQGDLTDWVCYIYSFDSNKEKRNKLGFLFAFWWEVLKERNRRFFENKELSIPRLSTILLEQV
jgi:hypothetical protein